MKLYYPGATLGEPLAIYAATGASVAPDATPTAVIIRNGVVDGAVTLTVTAVSGRTGRYHVAGTIPGSYAVGDNIDIDAAFAVGGVVIASYPITSFRLDRQVEAVYSRIGAPIGASISSDILSVSLTLDGIDSNVITAASMATTAATQSTTAATQATTAATQATTAATQATTAATNTSTILDRIGAFTGSGVNTVLGFLKALGSKAASTPSDMGGTYSAATDSTEAIRDRGDAAWTTGGGGGGGGGAATVYYQGRLQLTAVEAGADGRIYRTGGDPLQIGVQLKAGSTPVDLTGQTLTISLVDNTGASAAACTGTVQFASSGEMDIDATLPATPGLYRLTVQRGVGGQVYGPLLVEIS